MRMGLQKVARSLFSQEIATDSSVLLAEQLEFGHEFFLHGDMDVAIKLNEIGEQH